MKKIPFLLIIGLLSFTDSFSQEAQKAEMKPGYVLEVIFAKGSPIAFQKLDQKSVYGGFLRSPGYSLKKGESEIEAIRLSPHLDGGDIKVKVTLIKGIDWDIEETIADPVVGDNAVVINELKNFAVVPFEIRLVRAPLTVAQLPTIQNSTRSLNVSVEPVAASLPSFKVKILNSSSKPVLGFAHRTVSDGRTRLIGTPHSRREGNLIEPGQEYDFILPYPTVIVRESIGEAPAAQKVAQLTIDAVVFSDGTYEGDANRAAVVRGFKHGEKVQLSRIVSLLKSDAAASQATLSVKVERLSSLVSLDDLKPVTIDFPDLSANDLEHARSAAEVAAGDIQGDFKRNFGIGSKIPPALFNAAVKAAIAKCELLIEALP